MASCNHFYVDSPSLSASNSNDFGLEGNGCRYNFGGWPQPEKQSRSEQDQAEIYAMSLCTDTPRPGLRGHVSAILQGALHLRGVNHVGLSNTETDVESDSEALPDVKKRRASFACQSNGNWKSSLRNQTFMESSGGSKHPQLLSDKTLNAAGVIHLLDTLFNKVDVDTDEGFGQLRNRITQESLAETLTSDSQVSGIEEGVESKNVEERRHTSNTDLDEFLCSIRSLLSVIRNHEESQEKYRDKIKVLEERKKILKEEKRQYKRQRDSYCKLPV